MRTWAFWRRVQYGAGFFALFFLVFGGLYAFYGYAPSNCLDQKENGSEDGVDCGGRCARICKFNVDQPYVQWVESFRATDGMYNAVAYVENRNVNVGSPGVGYTIRLYDREGLITERIGTTQLPPNTLYPVFEGRIQTGDRTPTETTIEFDEDQVWVNAVLGGEQFGLVRRELTGADDKPVLAATFKNDSLDEALDVDVVATIFNKEGTALTSSRTKIPIFGGRSNRDITFTWQEPIAKTLRSCEVPSDVVIAIDLSGSMNDDGGTPPQPITAVLESAKDFAERLNEADQLGLVTYATEATTVETLTSNRTRVAASIEDLVIDPASERGSTNTGEAIRHAREELGSSRHNGDARKVLILLTDGLATAPDTDPEGYARIQADLLKASDIELFTIGLGEKLNEIFLTEIATDARHYFEAPSIATLGRIYEEITGAICEEGAAVIEIIPKQSAIYDPLIP